MTTDSSQTCVLYFAILNPGVSSKQGVQRMNHLLPAHLCPNLNAFFVYRTSNCLLVLTPLTHVIVHRKFTFHERQHQAKSKKPEIHRNSQGI